MGLPQLADYYSNFPVYLWNICERLFGRFPTGTNSTVVTIAT